MKKIILCLAILGSYTVSATDKTTANSSNVIRGGNSDTPNKVILGSYYEQIKSQPVLFPTSQAKQVESEDLFISQESFSDNSWGLLYRYKGQLYIQRNKVCKLSDGRSGKCPTSARCSIENANDLELCSVEVLPEAVENYFDSKIKEFSKEPNKLFQYIWNN